MFIPDWFRNDKPLLGWIVGGADGNATGRNIHQRSLDEAVRLTTAISAITLADWAVADALAVFAGEKDFTLADI